MCRFLFPSLAVLVLSVCPLAAQSNGAQASTFTVSPSQPWTDTGLDLQSGEVVTISATPGSQSATGLPACDPAGLITVKNPGDLPLKSANPGALVARLQPGSTPVLIGASKELHIDAPSHLFLGMNAPATPICQGNFSVKVERSAAAASATNPANQTRGEQLKSQLANAAQVFMSGQFGVGKPGTESNRSASSGGSSSNSSSAAPAAALSLSSAPLDPGLRKGLDSLPRRVNDQFNNLGDMVNFVIVGPKKDLQAALEAATWHIADTSNTNAVINAIEQTYEKKDYLTMPMSTLFLFGRKQDFGYEMVEPIAMVASRHHFRIWKAPFTWNGQEVWVGAGTHDIGFAKDQRNNNVTHKIDPAVDGERDNIGGSLQKAKQAKSLTYYLPPNPVQEAKNATGDSYHSDGRILVIFLQ